MKNRYSDMEAVVQPVRNSVRLCNLPPNSILFKAAALDREGKSTIRNQLQDREADHPCTFQHDSPFHVGTGNLDALPLSQYSTE